MSLIFDVLAIDRASHVFDKVGGSAARAGGQVESASNSMSSAAGKMAVGIGLAGATFAAVSVKMAADFQQSVTKLATTAGESTKNLKMVGDGMLNMAGQVGISANDLAKGMYIVESSGIHGAAALDVLKASAQGARQEGADLTKVTDAVTTAMHDYGPSIGNAAKVTSEMVTAVSAGKTTFDQLTGSLHSVTPLASALHVPFADIIGSLAAMTASGESADQATQNMAQALRSLQKPTQPMIDEMAQLGITATDLATSLSTKGLSGTVQDLSQAIMDHMGPSGKVLMGTFNDSKIAADDARQMFSNLPPALQKVATAYENGKLSVADWRKAIKAMPADEQMLITSWKGMQDRSDGFNQMLKSGKPVAQQYTAALEGVMGTSAGLSVALQLTGAHASVVNQNVKDIAASSGDAKGNIKGWAEVQGNMNQQLAQAEHAIGAMAIQFGQHLLPVLTTGLGWVNTTGIPAFKNLASGVGDAVKWFTQLPGPVKEAAVALGIVKALAASDMFAGLVASGRVLAVGFANDMSNMVASARAGAGQMTAAFAEAKAAQQALVSARFGGGAVPKATGDIAGLGAAAGVAARGGLSAMGKGLSGIVNMLGGPWGVALIGATVGVGLLMKAVSDHNAQIKADTESVKSWYEAMASKGGAAAVDGMNNIRSKTLELAKAQADLNKLEHSAPSYSFGQNAVDAANAQAGAITAAEQHVKELSGELQKGKKQWDDYWNSLTPQGKLDATVAADEATLAYAIQTTGTNSLATKSAIANYNDALSKQKTLAGQVADAEQSQVDKLKALAQVQLGAVSSSLAATQAQSQFNQAVDAFKKGAADGTVTGQAFTDQSNALAQQAIDTAQAIGKQEHDQLAANHQTDDGTLANKLMLQSLKDSADHLTGPGHDALVLAYNDLLKATAAAGNMKDSATQMGLNVVKTFDNNTVVIKNATDAQIKDLQALGDKVTHLPDGNIVVTSDTKMAQDQLDALINDYNNKVIRVMTPTGEHVSSATGPSGTVPKNARGGHFRGVGTGTSDSNLSWISDGEFIVKASETSKHLPLLHAINDGAIPAFANGGLFKMYDTISAGLSAQAIAQAEAQINTLAQQMANPPGSGVGRWRSDVDAVLRLLGQPTSYDGGVLDMIQAESGGNPAAINLTDSNAAAGHPSQGLMQTIPATFAAYAGPYIGRGITDGFANIYAGVNYALQRYGPGILASGGRHSATGHYIGYETGTDWVPETGPYVLHKGEAVLTAEENASRGKTVQGQVFHGPVTITDTDAMAARAFQHASMADARFS
jgi:hypothetical protein